VGEAILGTLGSGDGRRLTVIGDAVNLASRVESANRDAGTALLVTEDVRREAGEALTLGRRLDLPIKGKTGVHALYEVLAVRETGGS
jgi:class 3 adenylate cyclase